METEPRTEDGLNLCEVDEEEANHLNAINAVLR